VGEPACGLEPLAVWDARRGVDGASAKAGKGWLVRGGSVADKVAGCGEPEEAIDVAVGVEGVVDEVHTGIRSSKGLLVKQATAQEERGKEGVLGAETGAEHGVGDQLGPPLVGDIAHDAEEVAAGEVEVARQRACGALALEDGDSIDD
jgi:hypothetical protein